MDFVTIDGVNSRDLDDAIWIGRTADGFRVVVAVADVASQVSIGSAVDLEAMARGFSVYRADRIVQQMLPLALSEGVCSLNVGKSCPAVVVDIALDLELDVMSVEVARRPISIARRLSHESAIGAAAEDDPVGAMLRDAFLLSEALLRKRRAAGALAFSSRGLLMNEEGAVMDLGRLARSYVLVQEFMILANASLAFRMAERGVPLLYRNHRARLTANRGSLEHDLDMMAEGALSPMTFESRRGLVMEPARVGPTVEGHFALNLPVYAWFTSPIRRFADLVNHRILLADLEGSQSPYRPDDLKHIAGSVNARYEEEAARESQPYKKRAVEAALKAVADGRASRLEGSGFTQAVKAMAGGAELGEAFIAETRRRSQEGLLTSKDLYRLLFMEGSAAGEARAIAIKLIETRPDQAYAIVNYAQTVAGWTVSEPEPEAARLPNGALLFKGRIGIVAVGRKYAATAYALQKKLAMQRAMAAALMVMVGETVPAEWTVKPELEVKSKPAKAASPPANAKGELLMMCRQRSWPTPTFEVVKSGPDHSPNFDCTVSVVLASGVLRGQGSAGSRRAAEGEAAAALMAELTRYTRLSA